MAVVERISRITFSNGLGSTREFLATAATLDTAAGSSVVVTVTQTTTGGVPPAVPDTFDLLFVNDSGGTIRTASLTAGSASQTVTFFFTDTGLTGGSARCGTVEMNLRAVKTTGGPTATYNAESDGSPATGPTGFTTTSDRGWIRSTTTATLSTSNVSAGGATPATFAYPDQLFQRATLGAAPYVSRTLTVAIGAVKSGATGSSSTTVFDRTHTGVVDTAFAASSSSYAQTVTASNATLTGLPFTVFTATTAPSLTVDPRLSRIPLFQLDDNTFGTPPLSKDVPSHRRLTTQQGFLGSRSTNARGEGVNGVVYNVTLTPRKPGTAVSQTGLTTTTQGGQTGWAPTLLPWSSSLPSGIWDKAVTITSPSGYTGSYVVQTGSTEYTLIARDPNLEVRLNVQHEPGLGGRHFTAGMALIPTAYLIDVSTGLRLMASSFTMSRCSVIRVAAAANPDGTGASWEFLNTSLAWESWETAEAQATHTMSTSPADATTVEKRFATDSTWGVRDIRFNVAVEYEGVLYSATYIVVNVGPFHLHDTAELAGGDVTPADITAIANAVWDETTAEARTAGSFGQLLKDRIDAAVTTRLASSDTRLDRLDVAVGTRATPADVNASTASLLAASSALAQQITDLAAAGVDDATTAQVNTARDAVLASLAALAAQVANPAQAAALTAARDQILAAIEATDATIGGVIS